MKIARVGLLALLAACDRAQGPEPATGTPPDRPDPCTEYRNAVDAARREHGDMEAQVFNSCGCSFTIHTSADRAATLRERYPAWSARCSVNCDTPCSAMAQ